MMKVINICISQFSDTKRHTCLFLFKGPQSPETSNEKQAVDTSTWNVELNDKQPVLTSTESIEFNEQAEPVKGNDSKHVTPDKNDEKDEKPVEAEKSETFEEEKEGINKV